MTLLAPLALVTTGCGRGCGEALVDGGDPLISGAVLESGPPAMSPGTLRALGSHVWDASLDIRGDRAGLWPSRDVVARLVWAGLGEYEYEVAAGGRIQREIHVDGKQYRRQSNGGRYLRTEATAGDALVQQQTLVLWNEAIGPFSQRVAWRRVGPDTVEGRAAVAWRLELAPLPTAEGSGLLSPEQAADRLGLAVEVIELGGTVYVDELTGNRLLAEITGRFVGRALVGGRDPTDEVLLTYRERRTLSSLPPTVEAPPPEQVVDLARRMRPAGQ